MSQTAPQTGGWPDTHAQTDGELSKAAPAVHITFCAQEQIPGQSAPPAAGSQPSLGSSTHFPFPGHAAPESPPQETFPFWTSVPSSAWPQPTSVAAPRIARLIARLLARQLARIVARTETRSACLKRI